MSAGLHPIMAGALAHWMPKQAPAHAGCAQAAINSVADKDWIGEVRPRQPDEFPSLEGMTMAQRMEIRRAELRDEYDSGLDAVDLPDDWEPEQ